MYTPKQFVMQDQQEMLSFMRQYSFATIVTVKENVPTATHLPFHVAENGDALVLTSHMAKANPQWQELTGGPALVIFTGPHAYVSPRYYDSIQSVPTWNYLAVHAYGVGELIEEEAGGLQALEEMIDVYEQAYQKQWATLSMEYKRKMLRAIVPFRLTITKLEGKKKLSQNKTATEKQRIVEGLMTSHDEAERQLAISMQKELATQAAVTGAGVDHPGKQ
jgi:transcriptional regulator